MPADGLPSRWQWSRRLALDAQAAGGTLERWECLDGDRRVAAFDVEVCVGKPLDVVALKGASLHEVRRYAAFLAEAARRLYGRDVRRIAECPCCAADAGEVAEGPVVHGVAYVRCRQCGHAFVGARPSVDALEAMFAASDDHAAPYTDAAGVEVRLAQVVAPKLRWVMETFRRRHGREAASVVDVGAGGGHFVAVAHRAGLRAEGYEICAASRRFAREIFDVELRDADFVAGGSERVDVVTFWGLLEYTPEPRRYLEAARRRLGPDGLLVVEVPRYEALGTAVQRQCPDTVARHLDPTSHVNCFSDASVATALLSTGFQPTAAWYFGMDAYELVVQAALRVGADAAFDRLVDMIPGLQAALDAARLCDDLVVAAVPLAP
jgi:2-polyprenyl-3-methyl-5-hydroxy-6-metoxy-1,4-benzoquinol methylase